MFSRTTLAVLVALLTVIATLPGGAVGAIASDVPTLDTRTGGTPPPTPTVTSTTTSTPTSTATSTPRPTSTSTSTSTPAETPAPTPTPTETPAPTATPTPTPAPAPTSGADRRKRARPDPLSGVEKPHPKLTSAVIRAAERAEQTGSDGWTTSAQSTESGETFVTVRIEAESGRATGVANAVTAQGGQVHLRVDDVMLARIPTSALTGLSETPGVTVIRTPIRTRTTGHEVTEGITVMNVSDLHAQGIDGTNVDVVVVDHGFDATNAELSDQVVEVRDFTGSGFTNTSGEHGTAVAEIVAEVAPEANLRLYRAMSTTGIAAAADHIDATDDIDVVVMSLGVDVGPFDGSSNFDDRIGQSVDDGQNWFVSAGNSGQRHYGGTWNDPDGDGYHNFSATDSNLSVVPRSDTVTFTVNWDDWGAGGSGGSDQDYDIVVVDGGGTVVETSVTRQDGEAGDYPVEEITVTNANGYTELHLFLNESSATGDASFDVFVSNADISDGHVTPAGSLTRPATEEKVDTVGAVYWDDLSLRGYSSRGPTDAGVRKPEFVAPDGTSSTVYGSAGGYGDGFTGTSAAAPHAGGVAALLLEADGSLSPTGVTENLTATADLLGVEPNNQTGYGLVNASAAVAAVTASEDGEDVTDPVLAEATATDTTDLATRDDAGVVADGDAVEVSVAVSDVSTVTVTANASDLGGPDPLALDDGDGDGVYDGTFTVDAASAGATDGSYSLTVNATDAAGNWNTTTATLVLDMTAPTVSNAVTTSDDDASPNLVGTGGLLNVSADANDANPVEVRVDAQAVGHASDELLGDSDEDGTYDASLPITDSVADGTYTFTVTVTDAAGNTATTTTDDIVVDTTTPSLSNAVLRNASDASAVVDQGDTAEVRAEVSDARLTAVTADVSALGGAESLTLTDGDGDGVYDGTFVVGSVYDGTYQASVTATDEAGNANTSTTTEVTVGTPDETAPDVSNAGAFDLTDGDGTVADGDSVKVNVTATDDVVVGAVSVDATNFGAGTVSLTDEDGDDVWNATFVVGESGSVASDGTQTLSFTAADASSNTNTTTASLVVDTSASDTTAPTVSNFGVQVDTTTPLAVDVLFESDEQVTDVDVVVTNESGATVATLTEAELSESPVGGGYLYFHTYTLPEAGSYDVTLTTAADAAGNDGASGETTTVRRVVERYSVEHVGGTAPDVGKLTQNVYVPQGGSLLQIQLRDADDSGESVQNRTELSDIGFASDTRMRINVTVGDGYVPRLLLGTGRNGSYTVTDNGDGTTNLSVELEPASAQLLTARMSGGPYGAWPAPATEDTADEAYTAVVDLAVDEMAHVSSPDDYNGTMILTDAQELGTPTATTTGSGDPALRLFVAGPHNTTQGTLNSGFYETFLPDSLLTSWGVTDPSQLQVNAIGSDVTPTATETDAGVKLDVPIHYSSGNVDVSGSSSGDTTAPSLSNAVLRDASNGDGVVADGDSLTVAVDVTEPNLQSVTVDASAFGAGSRSLSDGDGDGTYDTTFTVDDASTGADGSYTLTVAAADTAGNANTATTGAVRLDTTAPAADAGTDRTVDVDESVPFDASASSDASGIDSYGWTFGDGDAATGVSPGHTYTSAGDYTVTLTVTDAAGNTATDTVTVTVEAETTASGGSGGSGGLGGAAPAPAPTTPATTPESSPPETEPTVTAEGDAAASVERAEAGVTVAVTGAKGTDQVSVTLPAADVTERVERDGLALESMATTFARETGFSADVSSSIDPPTDGTPAVDGAVGYVTVDTGDDFEEADVSEVTFGFTVSTSRLAERGLASEDVVLYRYHAAEWTALETRVVGEEEVTVRFEAVSPGLSTFAVGSRDALDDVTTGATTPTGADDDQSTPAAATETATVTATPAADTGTVEDATPTTATEGPGFGAVAVLVAVLVSVLALRRRD